MAAVVESIKKSLHLSDTQLGLVGTGFIVVYTLTSPLFGTLGDRRARPPLIALGVAVWSVATSLAGFARGFTSLFVARSTVGVGEAAYGTIAPALLADSFPIERRGRVLSVFFAAIPIGSAAGYVLGGLVDQHFGWRAAFWIAGAPGLLLALLVMLVKDPPRGLHDVASDKSAPRHWLDSYRDLLRNRPFILTALGYGAYTFALGGLAFWMPAFLERVRGMPRSEATVTFGAIALVTGFVGTFAGGWLGDLFLPRSKQSYLWVSGIATLLAAPATFVAVSNPHRAVYLTAIVIAEVLIFMSHGPGELGHHQCCEAGGEGDGARLVGSGDAPARRHPVAAADRCCLRSHVARTGLHARAARDRRGGRHLDVRGMARKPSLRRFVTPLLRLIANIFFRRIENVGWEKVPAAPVIFAVNHPNGLIDPLFLLCFTPRPISFLAKAPLFRMPLIGWFARGLDSIPVYRTQDNFSTAQNRETFAAARRCSCAAGRSRFSPRGRRTASRG